MSKYKTFVEKINRKLNIDLNLYKEAQMKRRITSLRNKRGYPNFNSYFQAISDDEIILNEFLDRITINVSEFYRNPQRWDVLREKVLPEIIKNNQTISIWSAACSTGEEPYSLAIMLKEHFPNIRANILATDIDDNVLKKAQEGIFNKTALKDLPDYKKSKYFINKNNKFYVDDELKQMITYKKHNLLNDPYPTNVDLIVCRNVLIYFTDTAKQYIYNQFEKSLKHEGILFVGSTEQIFNPQKYNLTLFDTFFYQKI